MHLRLSRLKADSGDIKVRVHFLVFLQAFSWWSLSPPVVGWSPPSSPRLVSLASFSRSTFCLAIHTFFLPLFRSILGFHSHDSVGRELNDEVELPVDSGLSLDNPLRDPMPRPPKALRRSTIEPGPGRPLTGALQ